MPPGPDVPEWVVLGGCTIEPGMTDRHCDDCTYEWASADEPRTRLYYGTDLWDEISPITQTDGPRKAAIAFLGHDAPDLLAGFQRGDRLIVNAGPRALTSGATSAEALAALFKRGVRLASHDRLHAKVLVTEHWAVIGSSNASNASNRSEEAGVITDDEGIVADATTMIDGLWAQAEAINASFIARARKLAKDAPRGPGGVPGIVGVEPFPPRAGSVYFVEAEDTDLPDEVQEKITDDRAAVRKELGRTPGRILESWWDPHRSTMAKDDILVRVTQEADDYYLEQPSLIVSKEKVPGRGNGWVYILQSLRDRDGIWWSDTAEEFARVGITSENVLDTALVDRKTRIEGTIDGVLNLWPDC